MSATSIWRKKDPFAAAQSSSHTSPPIPTVAGYEILDEWGRGGMGVVYKARQVGLDRIVALKMIRAGDYASTTELARFQTEAEAIARLHHPNIVQVYEVGEHEGKPFLSLEFCAGGSLHQKLAGSPLHPGQAATLLETLSRAMAAAHQANVIHRDLKPANVLLASGGKELPRKGEPADASLSLPKITDFGLAKKLDEVGQTHTGAIMGTPSYMAPEQAAGRKEIGPLADVYALGAILYECLTGRPPFNAATTYDTLTQVTSSEPVPPRRLNAKVPIDLETICSKCLRKEPHRRYGSALDLAEDLRRWLDDEPILARPVGPLVRLAKWAGRQPAVAALTASLVFVAAVGLLAVIWQWRIAEKSKLLAEDNEEEARTAQFEESEARALAQRKAREADARFRQARDAVDKMLTGVADERLAGVPQAEQVRRELLGEALAFYRGFLREKADDPELIRETARAYRRVGDIERLLGEHAEAEQAYLDALALLSKEGGRSDGVSLRATRGAVYAVLGEVRAERGQHEQAEQSTRLALAERKLLAEEVREDPRYRRDLAESYNDLGSRLAALRQYERAEESHRAASKIWEDLVEQHPTKHEPRKGRARSCYNLGSLLFGLNRRRDAEALYTRAIEDYEKLTTELPNVVEYQSQLARVFGQLGLIQERNRDPIRAEKSFGRSVDLQRKLVESFPGVPRFRRDLAVSLYNLGNRLNRQKRGEEALEQYRSAIELMEKVVADAPSVPGYRALLSTALFSQGNYHNDRGRPAEAEPIFRRAVELQQALVDRYPLDPAYRHDLGRSLNNLSQALQHLSRFADAVPFAERAVARQREALKLWPKNPAYLTDLQIHYWTLAGASASSKKHAEAARAAKEYALIYPDHWLSHYRSGRLLLWCSLVAEEDTSLSAEKRTAPGTSLPGRIGGAREMGHPDRHGGSIAVVLPGPRGGDARQQERLRAGLR
jgi:tetratricopeptide (TPR) repeat protein/tRNA A-37 threonylcarbamoyl transferase component Bud32